MRIVVGGGILKRRYSRWTAEEIDILRSLYPFTSVKELKKLLPNHTGNSIRKEAEKLKLRKEILPWNKGLHGDPRILASIAYASSCRHPETWKGRKGHKPWTLGLTAQTSPKLKAAIEKGATRKRGVKQDPETITKRAESIRRHYQEHPEARAKLRENGLKLARSPYHHRRVPGEYTLPQESRDKISRTLKKLYREQPEIKMTACASLERGRLKMRSAKTQTEPERKIGGLLKSLDVGAIPQYGLNGFVVDFALPEQKLAVLVDGCYWHCCPIHFPIAETKSQQHNVGVDKRRETALKKAGWRVIHIWEHEVDNPATLERLRKEVMPNAYPTD